MISVIVPIYNTENYLQKCLNSLISQSFPNVEFILIDDGSTDKSGVIADQYTEDSRFRVFHTENHGLSAARNFGIEQSHGEWLMFVDGDDWVEPGFCGIPYQAAVQCDADVVIFRSFYVKNGKIKGGKSSVPAEIIDLEKAVKCGGAVVWNKLYKRELLNGIRFPEGRVHEDVATTHKILMKAKRIIMIPDCLYFHVYRKDSISNCFSVKNKRDAFVSVLERAEDLEPFGCTKDFTDSELTAYAIAFLIITYPSDDQLYRKAVEIIDSVKSIPSYLPWKRKVLLMVWKTNKPLFHLIRRTLHKLGVFQP